MQKGVLPTRALGMDRGGRPKLSASVYKDGALIAEYLQRVSGVASDSANDTASILTGRVLDRRELQRQRARVRRIGPSVQDLVEQYRFIARKYGFEPMDQELP